MGRPFCIPAPYEPGQHLGYRVLSVAGSGFSSTGTLACALCMGDISIGHRQECLCHAHAKSGATAPLLSRTSP
jgi:hypothetical protein